MKIFDKIKNEMGDWLKETRYWFHQHPELSKQEFETANKIEETLKSFGFTVDRSFSKTSIVASLKNGDSDKTIAFRTDMDALPLKEENDFNYKSKNEGKMHACGHDGHMTIVLGLAKYLSENRNFNGTVILIFQCAEEIGFGAQELINNGLFKKYKIDKMFAFHGMSNSSTGGNLPEGALYFYSKTDAMMAAVRLFEAKFIGEGGHGSEPENTIDAIPAAVEYVNSVYLIKNRMIPSINRSVLSVCNIQSGTATAANIIPDYCVVKGTLRTVDNPTLEKYEYELKNFADLTAQKHHLKVEYNIQGIDATINNLELCAYAKAKAIEWFGNTMVGETKQVMGGEDFGLFGKHCPICLIFISTGENVPIHNTKYDFRDTPVPYGVAFFAGLTEDILK